jgi:hypothetical protein
LSEENPRLRGYFGYFKGEPSFLTSPEILVDPRSITPENIDRLKANAEASVRLDQKRQKCYLLYCLESLFRSCGGYSSGIEELSVENEKRAFVKIMFSQLVNRVEYFDLRITYFKELITSINEAVFTGKDILRQVERQKNGGEPISLRLDLRGITGRPSEFLRYSEDYEKFAAMMREGIDLINEFIAFYTSIREAYESEIATRTQDAKVLISQFVKRAAKLCKDALKFKAKMQKLSVKYYAEPSQDTLSEYSNAFASFQSCAAQYRAIYYDELPKITAAKITLMAFPILSSEDVKLSHNHLPHHYCNTALGVL